VQSLCLNRLLPAWPPTHVVRVHAGGLYLATPALRIFTRYAPLSLQRGTCVGLLALVSADSFCMRTSDPSVFFQFIPFIGTTLPVPHSLDQAFACAITALCAAIIVSVIGMILADRMSPSEWRCRRPQYVLDELSPAAIVPRSASIFSRSRRYPASVLVVLTAL